MEKTVDDNFSDLEKNLLKAIAASNAPSAPPGSMPGSSGGTGVATPSVAVKDATARFEARPGGNASPTPPWVEDVTTPLFNRPPNPTKLFCNIQIAKSKFRETVVVLVLEAGLKETDFVLIGDALEFCFEL